MPNPTFSNDKLGRLIAHVESLWPDPDDRAIVSSAVRALDARYALKGKLSKEPGVAEIITQMVGRLAHSFGTAAALRRKRVLDIACGSNTSRMPAIRIDTPLGQMKIRRASRGYTAQFEPWMCRLLLELGASPVGIDFGDLDGEPFTHHEVDLGQRGALDFLPDHSFDAVQDSRLFGSPEFTALFPRQADRLNVAREIVLQERRLLQADGILIHSDAEALLR
jgi:hypothetical protein